MAIRDALSGKKTYIVAGISILGVWFAYFSGYDFNGAEHALTLKQAAGLTLDAILAVTIRAGIASK